MFELQITAICSNCVSTESLDNGNGDKWCKKFKKVLRFQSTDICKYWKPSSEDVETWISRVADK